MATAAEKRMRAALEKAILGLEIGLAYAEFDDPAGAPEMKKYIDDARAALAVSEKAAQGRSNRSRGHDSERLVVQYLKRDGRFPDADTTRNRLGHDGTRQPGDVWFCPGVVLSVKHVKTPQWPAWIREVTEEAKAAGPAIPDTFSPRVPAVVHRKLGETDVGAWPCAVPLAFWDRLDPRLKIGSAVGDYAKMLDNFHVGEGEFVEHCRTGGNVAVMRFETLVSEFELTS